MKKKIIALLIWLGLGGSVAFGQSIQGSNFTTGNGGGIDGSNVTAAKELTLPQVQPTIIYNASPTVTPLIPQPTQVTNWMQMNGNGAALVEFQANTLAGNYGVQVSDNLTPVSTPGTGIQTIVQDDATWTSGGAGAQTKNWNYMIRDGFRWLRIFCIPESTNTGTLNASVRLFGNPPPGDAGRAYTTGIPWKQTDVLAPVGTVDTGAATLYYEYKVPSVAKGFNLYTNIAGVSGASTITTTIYSKDPLTGQLQSLGVGAATHAAAFNFITLHPGYAAPYPQATPPTGYQVLSVPVAQDIVIGNAFAGTGSTTFSQNISPIGN